MAAAEAEYTRVLDLRECLRVEEVAIEMQMDMGQTFLEPRVYHAFDEHLGEVRIFIWRACQSLLYIQNECFARGLELDIESISKYRIANRPPNHPFFMISRLLKPGSWKIFNDYHAFSDDGMDKASNANANAVNDTNMIPNMPEDEDEDKDKDEDDDEDEDGDMLEEDTISEEDDGNDGDEGTKSCDAQSDMSLPEPVDEQYYVPAVDGFVQTGSHKPPYLSEPIVVHPSNFLPIHFSSDTGQSHNLWEDISMI